MNSRLIPIITTLVTLDNLRVEPIHPVIREPVTTPTLLCPLHEILSNLPQIKRPWHRILTNSQHLSRVSNTVGIQVSILSDQIASGNNGARSIGGFVANHNRVAFQVFGVDDVEDLGDLIERWCLVVWDSDQDVFEFFLAVFD